MKEVKTMHIEIEGKDFAHCPYCGKEIHSVEIESVDGERYYIRDCSTCLLGWELDEIDWPG